MTDFGCGSRVFDMLPAFTRKISPVCLTRYEDTMMIPEDAKITLSSLVNVPV